ncbi:MAG: penicillin-binding transpeptidase domain-containing protein [Myxococcales bacterium]|nr:penicillin-binding transpeptidase domain-containing protein [Myxococcales bacterium]
MSGKALAGFWTAAALGSKVDAVSRRMRVRSRLGRLPSITAWWVAIALAALAATGPTATTAPGLAQPRTRQVQDRGRRASVGTNVLDGFDPSTLRADGSSLVVELPGGRRAQLTLDPPLQAHLQTYLARHEVPYASVVAIEPSTGRVLAYVNHSTANPAIATDLALDPTPPAASVFKLVTAAALLEAGVDPDRRVCYGGGFRRLSPLDLVDDPRRDRHCANLEDAVGSSINAVFAKLALRHLDTARLERHAAAFGFGHALPFDVRTRPSPVRIPDREREPLEFARAAAGFWHVHMSPLHGALVASVFAADGRMPRPTMVDRVLDARGRPLHRFEPSVFRQVLSRTTARAVGRMMQATVTRGTSRRAFHDRAGRPRLGSITAAGKTGTLSNPSPYRGYTWWVGFAPAERPSIALAALVVNGPRWRIKASDLACEALRRYLRGGVGASGAAPASSPPSSRAGSETSSTSPPESAAAGYGR